MIVDVFFPPHSMDMLQYNLYTLNRTRCEQISYISSIYLSIGQQQQNKQKRTHSNESESKESKSKSQKSVTSVSSILWTETNYTDYNILNVPQVMLYISIVPNSNC